MKVTCVRIPSVVVAPSLLGATCFEVNAVASRGRPHINAADTMLVSDTGTRLRGMICGSNPGAIPQTTNYGCNAVHLPSQSAPIQFISPLTCKSIPRK